MGRKGKVPTAFLVAAISILLIGAVPAHAQKCVSSQCHSGMGKAEFVHGPLSVGQCVVCHTSGNPKHPTGSVNNDFKLQAQGKELCYLCHEAKDDQKVVHDPIADGDCISCHDPHQSGTEKQLTGKTTSELCFSCHEDDMTRKNMVHGPVSAGDCNICHNPHSSPFDGLVEMEGSDLCFLCHSQAQFELKYKHLPVTEACNKCHNSHATDFPYMLTADGETLCLGCHREMDRHLNQSRIKHSALEEKDCGVCHTSHASDYPRQLKSSTREICYTCHEEMGAQVKASTYVHGPVQQDDCYACHDSHGSNFTSILKKPFPAEFYIPYATENYAICFDCHNPDIAVDRFTTTLTRFRNGDQNMHFLHVNREKGRSCRACHEMHAGDQARHIRREVPFGKVWMLPVNFTQHENGGNCVVGCHKPKDYDRVNPVKY